MKVSKRLLRVLLGILTGAFLLIIVAAAVFIFLQASGKNSLYNRKNQTAPDMELAGLAEVIDAETMTEDDQAEQGYTWQEGDIRYEGNIYRYNRDALTFLFMGIDRNSEVQEADNGIHGGQSDALFLLILNHHTKEASVIGIPRDTMTEISVYNSNGDYMGDSVAQIALQHGYGDGGKISCERTETAVSQLFYGLNINGYCAINMAAIPKLNDAVGGVELQVLEDVPNTDLKAGTQVTLTGQQAYAYLSRRDVNIAGSAGKRLERQKQYLTAYAEKALQAVKKDLTMPVTLYSTLSKYMVTDISIDEVSYLATVIGDYHFESNNLYSLTGDIVAGDKFEEYYIDEKALYELILSVFYDEIDMEETAAIDTDRTDTQENVTGTAVTE